ncbi:MAG: U32 family peptidase [Erysipelotrichaceae bacterium]|nr:U32 family peptidase [Erysipelotrichaceae bacterium]
MKHRIELLSPAGDLARAKIAIRYGADAVYLGGKKFSLRSRASNFDIEDIAEAVRYANEYGAHIHVTVNIIPHEEDFEGLEEYLKTLESIGVTAIIVASPSIIKLAKRVAPKLEVHLSTQMSSTNLACVKLYERWGVDRVVLARECSMEQIRHICKNTELPIEAFVHGAMCANFSGRCTLSNAMTLRDANRGGCAQSCRWKYHLMDKDEMISEPEHPFSMSSKDLLAFEHVYDMMKANVASLKIEGRMKSGYYIATVIKTYRMLIDELERTDAPLSPQRVAYYANEFTKAENRPTCYGFLDHEPDEKDHLYGINGAGVTHDFLAVVLEDTNAQGWTKIEVRNRFAKGEIMEVFGPSIDNERFVVEEIRDTDGMILDLCNKPMTTVWVKCPFEMKAEDMIRRGVRHDC